MGLDCTRPGSGTELMANSSRNRHVPSCAEWVHDGSPTSRANAFPFGPADSWPPPPEEDERMTAHGQQGQQTHAHDRLLRRVGLTAALGLIALAALLWFIADATATKECFDTGYGLGDSTSMTEQGCEVTVRAADGIRSAVLPTLSEPLARTALFTAAGSALPPTICLWLATRRTR